MRTVLSPLQNITKDHLDFINAINTIIGHKNIKYDGVQIKGHQDEKNAGSQLTWWEQRNVEMNDLAKSYMQQLRFINPPREYTHLREEGLSISI